MLTPRLVLHAGSDKAGSTTLQHVFFNNRAALKKYGLLYPETGLLIPSRHHKDLTSSVFDHDPCDDLLTTPHIPRLTIPRTSPSEFGRLLQDEIAKEGPHTVLISSEALFHVIYTPEKLVQIRDILAAYSVMVVLIVRNLADWVRSRWAHQVRFKPGFRLGPEEWTELLRDAGQLDYVARLDALSSVFGAPNVKILMYDDAKRRLLESFWQVAGLPDVDDDPLVQTRMNVWPTWLSIRAMHKLNRWGGPVSRRLHHRIPGFERGLSRTPLRALLNNVRDPFPDHQITALNGEWSKQAERLEKHMSQNYR